MSERETPYWPVFGLVLRHGDLVLRPLIEADLDALTRVLPADLEMNPHTPRPFGLDDEHARAAALHQEYWKALAGWAPDAWELNFGVWKDGRLLGTQTLEGTDFAVLRTVETASWLTTAARGQGLGKQARLAVLGLAFEGLGAQVALTEAWADNETSLGVSRSLGYRPNGSVLRKRDDTPYEMPHLRMDLADWRAVDRPQVHIEGLAPCLRWFGITPQNA